MEKRSRRRTRDLVTQPAFQGLSENESGCARISIMARSTSAPFKGRIQNRKTYHFHSSNLTCNARPVHTDGSFSEVSGNLLHFRFDLVSRPIADIARGQLRTKSGNRRVARGGLLGSATSGVCVRSQGNSAVATGPSKCRRMP